MRIVETTSASERAAAARRTELAGRHARLASLCELLEEIADDLPRACPSRCHRAATALQTLLPEHHAFTRELFSRLLSKTQPDVLENIVRQQGEEEGLGLEIVQALGAWPDGAGVPDPETLGYMLRCFFNGCRRSMLVEELALRSAEPAGGRTAAP